MTDELPFYPKCFVCGDKRRGSLGLRFRREDEKVVSQFVLLEKHMGYPGIVHGGILAAILDEAMAWAVFVKDGHFAVSAEIKVRYTKPLPPGQPVRVLAYVVNQRRNIYEVAGEISDDSGVVYARAWGRSILAPPDYNRHWLQVIKKADSLTKTSKAKP
ncbi:MAG: PaaI family thioesterase [Armatimonadetes bacterium]|nr:PaaI family thioesterase [Armatimonadota bacterium]MDW8123045.1 PaaI family thioesterase [Armatimonadota bacterium]